MWCDSVCIQCVTLCLVWCVRHLWLSAVSLCPSASVATCLRPKLTCDTVAYGERVVLEQCIASLNSPETAAPGLRPILKELMCLYGLTYALSSP